MQCFKEMLSDQEIENFEEELNRMRFREYENPFLDNLSSWMDEDQSTGLFAITSPSLSKMGVPEGGAAAAEDQVLAEPSASTDEKYV